MNTNQPVAGKLFAMLGAVVLTASLMVASFAAPHQAHNIAGVIA
ncbi:MAG: hypothetical protein WA842_14040 [Croceibacterium sp.]